MPPPSDSVFPDGAEPAEPEAAGSAADEPLDLGTAAGSADLGPVGHEPVLMRETLEALDVRPGQTVVDCTLGRAGHAREIARRLGPEGLLIGTDVDPRNL